MWPKKEENVTYDTALELRRFAIKDIAWFNSILNHSDSAIKEAHQMAGRFARFVLQHFTVPLTHSDEKLVNAH